MKLCSQRFYGVLFLLLPSLGCFDPNTTNEQDLREAKAQGERNTKTGARPTKSTQDSSEKNSGNPSKSESCLEGSVRGAGEEISRNDNLSRILEFYYALIERSLDRNSRKVVARLREAAQNASSSPFQLSESIWKLQSESFHLNLTGRKDKQEKAKFLRDQINRYVDESGIMTKVYPEIVVPRGPLNTCENSLEGLQIRKIFNHAIVSEAIILKACSSNSLVSGECEVFQAWSEDLNTAFFIADRLLYERQITQFYSFLRVLHDSTEFIKGFATGIIEESTAVVVALPQMVLNLPELSETIYVALSDLPETYEKIKEIVEGQYERILQDDLK